MAGHMTFDPSKKHSLGHRAFFIFLFRRLKYILLFAAIAVGAWYSQQLIPYQYSLWGDYIAQIVLMIACVIIFMIFLRTYLEYRYYTYLFTDDAFIMTYGYLLRNEIATLYHQIQNVNIQRSIADRMIGVSQVIILMTGSDRDSRRNEIILPAIGRTKARLVQAELLRRARRHADARGAAEV